VKRRESGGGMPKAGGFAYVPAVGKAVALAEGDILALSGAHFSTLSSTLRLSATRYAAKLSLRHLHL